MQDGLQESHGHFRNIMSSGAGPNQQSPSATSFNDPRVMTRSRQHARRSVIFAPALQVHCYPPEVWGDDEEVDDYDEWHVRSYEDEDPSLAEEAALAEQERRGGGDSNDAMGWEGVLPDPSRARGPSEKLRRQRKLQAQQLQQPSWQQQEVEQQAAQQHQPQHQRIEEQRQQQQIMAQTMALYAAASSTQGPGGLSIRHKGSCEQLVLPQDPSSMSSSSSTSARSMDHIDASETKMSMTPLLVQDNNPRSRPPRQAPPRSTDPILPSELMQRQEEERKRTREEIEALEEAARNKAKQPSSSRPQGGAKFRKEPQLRDDDSSREKNKKGKSGGLFGRLFDRRRDRFKEKGTNDSVDISRPIEAHNLEEPGRSGHHTDNSGPRTLPRRGPALTNTSPPVSQHASGLRQRDREQQALYQQRYLTCSPASPPEAQPFLQTSSMNSGQGNIAPTLSPTSDGRLPRPVFLSIEENIDGDGSSLVPEPSVIRIFAGKKLGAEATFRTVRLNSSMSSGELVKQAIQRFRVPTGEDATDYYLTIELIDGSSAVLRPEEKPLAAFELPAEAALDLPNVKRSAVGSISSIASNLSQHPSIKKLPMNDFTVDTAAKIYLNMRGFELQLLICPYDLPDDMVFDPLTEAIVFKNTLRDPTQAPASSAPFLRKILTFPESITVAGVIKASLARFGIPHGAAAGSDEVEDNNTKQVSSPRVRYVLKVLVDGIGGCVPWFRPPFMLTLFLEHELMHSGKVVDSYHSYRLADRGLGDAKRRSIDTVQFPSPNDTTPEDPIFVLRQDAPTLIISTG